MSTSPWPLFGLRVVTPRLELRYPDDDDVFAIAELAAAGVHDPATMPFTVPWTDVAPPQQQRNTVQWYWRCRAEHAVDRWHVPFAVVVDGEIVGAQSMMADDFLVLREVTTGSWVGRAHQGQGIGREMRSAVLHLAFAGLGAEYALSGAFHDNLASQAVTAHHGYELEGRRRALRRGVPDWLIGYRLPRLAWEPRRRDDIVIHGLEPALVLFGLS